MSLAEQMLFGISEDSQSMIGDSIPEGHIVVGSDRRITVPQELRTLGVKRDKNIETVTFDCVRYWDGQDLSTFSIYLNYVLPDLTTGTYIPESIIANDGENVYHFDWNIKDYMTKESGKISFAITAIKTKENEDGEIIVDKQWGSLPNSECSIANGIDLADIPSEEEDASILAQMSKILEQLQSTAIIGEVVDVLGESKQKVISQFGVTEAIKNVRDQLTEVIDESNERISSAEETISKIEPRISLAEKKIKNIEYAIPDDDFVTDESVGYQKIVPENSFPYAGIMKIGGLSRRCTNLWSLGETKTSTSAAPLFNNLPFSIAGGKTYTMSFKLSATSGQTAVSFKSEDGGNVFLKDIGNSNYNNGGSFTFTLPKTPAVTMARIYTNTANTISEIMLNEGESALPFEPYYDGAIPVKVTSIDSVGLNLAVSSEDSSQTVSGISVTRNNGESYSIVNGSSNQSNAIRLFGYFKLPIGTYTASVVGLNTTDRLYIGKKGTENVIVNYISTDSPKTFELKQETECFAQFVFESGSSYSYSKVSLQIERGDRSTEHSQYFKNSITIPNFITSFDGYGFGVNKDIYNYIDFEKKQFVKRVEKRDLGDLEWFLGDTFYAYIRDKKSGVSNFVSDKYQKAEVEKENMVDKTITSSFQPYMIWIKDSSYYDVSALKESLKGVMIYYELETPIVTDISDLLCYDNYILVEGNGTITAVNEHKFGVPSEVIYQIDREV